MRISIINGDGTTTYTETLAPVTVTEDFSNTLDVATDALKNISSDTAATPTTQSVPSDLMSIFQEAAATYDVDINLLTAIARQESNFKTDATSSSGAMGVMQLMPATAQGLGVSDAYNAYENIMGGSKYISQLLQRYNGDTTLALAAYNAGSGNVAKYGGVPPFTETQNYVKKVLGYYQEGNQTASSDTTSSTTDVSSSQNRQEIYRQMLSLTNQLLRDRLQS